MLSRRDSKLFLGVLICIAILCCSIPVCIGGELSESESFSNFIRTVDPQNVLGIGWNGMLPVPHPCSLKLTGIRCNLRSANIVGIRLEKLNLSGIIDAESLCKLGNLRALSLAKNRIRGRIPNSISNCRTLIYLNLSSNLLSGRVPVALTKLKYLTSLDISNNHFSGTIPDDFKQEFDDFNKHTVETLISETTAVEPTDSENEKKSPSSGKMFDREEKNWYKTWISSIPLVLGIVFFVLFTYFMGKKVGKIARERKILKALQQSPPKTPPVVNIEEVKPEERRSELVLFVDEHEKFKMEDLLEATADLQSQNICSSLYKVRLKNNSVYAVKRLKKLQVSFEEFGKVMRQVGNLKHPNILPLLGYNSTNEEKLLIYKYQSNGSLLNIIEDYIEGKRGFPWKLRLSIATGIARGLDFIYQKSKEDKIIPHGNLKLSNILLDENEDPLISEYGFSKFLDPMKNSIFSSSGYTAPENTVTEQGDVFSFGVILLELLTGKTIEKTGIDLPKWVKAMVREEWTGEVFDKEVTKAGKQWAFPLLNVALKCVSNSPDDRPTMAEVLEKIEEIQNGNEDHDHDHSISSFSSVESCQQDSCLLHSVIQENWDTPGSNY